ncbi:high affinity cationic amino acid transporter 1-like [Aethina tumida]|uniref:high affinity cationic amino acid transporter 1-like n=1 Tax=Aethina tumida TaxID=116153 RepID=UPI00096B49EE|nr:high affinity cationic amino acid transporter 1-like [Aethina tumida]
MLSKFFQALTRRKQTDDTEESKLDRCLSLLDLTALGVGGTLGLGVYVLAGAVAKTVAGPAVCISFLIAAIASAVAGVCYAEFAARVPKAGSAYVYSYVSVGEFIAYIIGWNLILEYIIGTASVARGLSNYIDALADHKIREAFRDWMPMDVSFLSEYPDFLSFILVMLLTVILSAGVRESSILNNIFTVLNLITVGIVLVSGSLKADTYNWNIPKKNIPKEFKDAAGEGGFMPFGISGVMEGAAKCFYGFVGFDAVATTGEEAKNPQRNIPLAIVISLAVIFAAYFGISTVLTLMLPYYEQDKDAPFPYVFDNVGWHTIKWIVTSGAVFALCTSMLGAMFPLPRVIYAMAKDGVIFKKLAKIHDRTQTPLVATLLSGLFSGAMAALFNLEQLIDMMSIGTLLAYTIVAVCVLILRYQPDEAKNYPGLESKDSALSIRTLFNLNWNKYPNSTTSYITNWTIGIFSIFTGIVCAMLINLLDEIKEDWYVLLLFIIAIIGMLVCLLIIVRQPVEDTELSFKVPLVPFIPCLSVFFNLYLMLELDAQTWIRFIAWLIIGFAIYFLYGMRNSEEGHRIPKAKAVKSKSPEKEVTKF